MGEDNKWDESIAASSIPPNCHGGTVSPTNSYGTPPISRYPKAVHGIPLTCGIYHTPVHALVYVLQVLPSTSRLKKAGVCSLGFFVRIKSQTAKDGRVLS